MLAIAKLRILTRHVTIHQHSQSQHYATTTSTPFRSSAHNVSAVPPPPVEEPLSLHDQHLLRLDAVKRRVRSDWSAARWSREGFAHREWPSRPTLPSFLLERVKSTTATTTSSSAMTHDMNEPAIFQQNLQSDWPNVGAFSIEKLMERYGNCEFCVGTDDDNSEEEEDDDVMLTLADYLAYAARDCDGDDSPLYIFDDWILQSDNDDTDNDVGALKNAYSVPKQLFPDDYMSLLTTTVTTSDHDTNIHHDDDNNIDSRQETNVRPPYCWLLIGAPRSGTALHVDPNATSAWNTLVTGRKRWFLFPPEFSLSETSDDDDDGGSKDAYHAVTKSSTSTTVVSDSAIHWLYQQYHNSMSSEQSVSSFHKQHSPDAPQQLQRCYDFVQFPGETVYVPQGWRHAVINLEFSVAVTHNFVGPHNVDAALASLRQDEPIVAARWHQELLRHGLLNNDDNT